MTPPPSAATAVAPDVATAAPAPARGAEPVLATERKVRGENVVLAVFIAVPFVALLAAVPIAWGWGLGWRDLAIAVVMYAVSGHGITVGFHRYFTHGSFTREPRPQGRPGGRGLARHRGARSSAGSPTTAATTRSATARATRTRRGATARACRALTKGLLFAHIGWLFDVEQTNPRRYTPDLLKDRDIVRISRLFPALVAVSLLLPAVLGGLLSWSWQGAVTAFFWASLVRVGAAPPRHLVDQLDLPRPGPAPVRQPRPLRQRLVAGAAVASGESWHNLHHADPTCARHGVLRGQIDSSARTIWVFERLGWATDVRWPRADRFAAKRA